MKHRLICYLKSSECQVKTTINDLVKYIRTSSSTLEGVSILDITD